MWNYWISGTVIIFPFFRGDYVCDSDTISPGNRQNQPHVAAWDAPGMDFLSEEQTLKYLNRSNSIEVTKSPSTGITKIFRKFQPKVVEQPNFKIQSYYLEVE